MRQCKADPSCSTDQAIDVISAVKELHSLTSQELNKLLRDSDNFVFQHLTDKGLNLEIDVEKLARYLPMHLVAVLISLDRDAALFRYLMCGFRLLYNLCSLAPRHPKLEQILLDDVKMSEQLLDLVFYLFVVLGGYLQENHVSDPIPLLHSALVSCGLHLLTECISAQWQDLVHVLLAHPKVDIFMDSAFGAVCIDVRFLEIKLSPQHTVFCKTSLNNCEMVNYLCQQCEASLQVLHSLCQQKSFRERLVRNKELCGKGGVLLLARSILIVDATRSFKESPAIVAVVSRLKSKVISILLHLCESESISYLDEVASFSGSLDLAKSVALEIFELLKAAPGGDTKYISSDKTYPVGLLQLNAMRLADVFSDDSNFRSHFTTYFTEFMGATFLLPHGEFLSSWCSSDPPLREEDATLEFDPHVSAGWILDFTSQPQILNLGNLDSTYTSNIMSQASYAHQRTSLLIKVIANLHCFVPDICEAQEKNHFLHKFLECLQREPTKPLPGSSLISDTQKASTISRNMCSLLSHAESLIPNFLNKDDVRLLREFFEQIQSMSFFKQIEPRSGPADSEVNKSQGAQATTAGRLSPVHIKLASEHNRSGHARESISDNSAFEHVKSVKNEPNDAFRHVERKNKYKLVSDGFKVFTEIVRDAHSVETSGSDSSFTRDKNCNSQVDNDDFPKLSEYINENVFSGVQEGDKVQMVIGEEKQRRKRKRTIMNDEQMAVIERALVNEPDMQRNTALIQSWADKLSDHGSEVSWAQLRNWLNNRKARLARIRMTKDNQNPDKLNSFRGMSCESSESPIEDPQNVARESNLTARAVDKLDNDFSSIAPPEFGCPEQICSVAPPEGQDVGKKCDVPDSS